MKFLHTMLRVNNLEESIKFYVDILKLKLVRKSDYPHGKFTLAFLSYDINEEPFLELTYNWETDNYNLGNGFGHIAIGVDDLFDSNLLKFLEYPIDTQKKIDKAVAKSTILSSADLKIAKSAFESVKKRKWQTALKLSKKAKDKSLYKLVNYLYLKKSFNSASF